MYAYLICFVYSLYPLELEVLNPHAKLVSNSKRAILIIEILSLYRQLDYEMAFFRLRIATWFSVKKSIMFLKIVSRISAPVQRYRISPVVLLIKNRNCVFVNVLRGGAALGPEKDSCFPHMLCWPTYASPLISTLKRMFIIISFVNLSYKL